VAAGQFEQASTDFHKALTIIEHLLAAAPDNIGLQQTHRVPYEDRAMLAIGPKPDERLPLSRSQAILERMTAKEPDNLQWQSDLSSAYTESDWRPRHRPEAPALEAFRRSLMIREKIAAADANNTERRHDVS